MSDNRRALISSPIILSIFAIVAVSLVSITHKYTRPIIIEQERKIILRDIHKLITAQEYNNNIVADTKEINTNMALGNTKPVVFYRARLDDKPIACFFSVIAPDGYNGNIKFLIGIYYNGDITGMRVIKHRETPGLGDKIEIRKSKWIDAQFKTKSLSKPIMAKWLVKKDGGDFDQFTGATITPRAIVKASKLALIYFKQNRKLIFSKNDSQNNE